MESINIADRDMLFWAGSPNEFYNGNSNDFIVNKDVIDALSEDDSQYNIIAMSRNINEIISSNLWDTVIMLYEHLVPNGYLMIPIKNF